MKKSFLFFLLLIIFKYTSGIIMVNKDLFIENSLFQSNDTEIEIATINGTVFLNNTSAKDNLIYIENNNNPTQVTLCYLEKSNAKNFLGITSSGNIAIEEGSNHSLKESINITPLYSNLFSPLDTINNFSINETSNNTEIGDAFSILNTDFNAKEILINTKYFESATLNDTIFFKEDVYSPTVEAQKLLITNSTNINSEEIIIAGDFSLITKTVTEPVIVNLNTENLYMTNNIKNEAIENQTITMKTNFLALKDFIVSPELVIPYGSSAIVNVDDNGMLTIDTNFSPQNIKNLTYLKAEESITFIVNNSIDANQGISRILFQGNNQQTVKIEEIKGMGSMKVGNSLNSEVWPVLCKITGKVNTKNFNTNSGNQYDPQISNFKKITINSAEFTNKATLNSKLTCVKLITINNVTTDETLTGAKIVLDRNNGWIVGIEPGSSDIFKEKISDFVLSKEEFITSVEPYYFIENNEIIFSLCTEKLEKSDKSSLIINYDESGKPIYFEERGIIALAASQLKEIAKEIKDVREIQSTTIKKIEDTENDIKNKHQASMILFSKLEGN